MTTSIPLAEGNATVLLVDDDPNVSDVTVRMLKHIGYQVVFAANGSDALDAYANTENAIMAVLMDVSMPDMNGKECLKHLLEMDPQACVLLMSGHDLTDEEEPLFALGAKGVIQKPYDLGILTQHLRIALGS